MCHSGATCLSADYCFSELELALLKSNNVEQSGPHHHLIEN
jgi:hypothetical protein